MRPFARLQPAYHEYHRDIIRASKDGLIASGSEGLWEPHDTWSHLPTKKVDLFDVGSLRACNTRGLSPLGEVFLLAASQKEAPRVLDLGHGAGRASNDASDLLEMKEKREKAKIHSIGLSPHNPFLSLQMFAETIADLLPDVIRERSDELDPSLQWLLKKARESFYHDNKYSFRIHLDALLQLQRVLGFNFFDRSPQPRVDLQIIGKFPDESTGLPPHSYSMIHENHGPLAKSVHPRDVQDNIIRILQLLREDGVFVFKRGQIDRRIPLNLHELCIVIFGDDNPETDENDAFMIKTGSPLMPELLQALPSFTQGRFGNVFFVRDIAKLAESITGVPADTFEDPEQVPAA